MAVPESEKLDKVAQVNGNNVAVQWQHCSICCCTVSNNQLQFNSICTNNNIMTCSASDSFIVVAQWG